MIIFDISTLAYTSLHQLKDEILTEKLLRHSIMLKIGYTLKNLKNKNYDISNIVIACDSKGNWRRDIFPNYKASRKENRKKQVNVDWELFYNIMNLLYDEFDKDLPFKVVRIDRAEADDIIACLSKIEKENVIVSSDKDFRQLCKNHNNILYNPSTDKIIDIDDYNLFEHILIGDREDGIPNILSDKDVFVNGVRQTTLSKQFKSKLHDYEFNLSNCPDVNDDIIERIELNRQLIDLNKIPNDIKNEILNKYNEKNVKIKKKYFNYMVKHGLTKLMESGVFNGI